MFVSIVLVNILATQQLENIVLKNVEVSPVVVLNINLRIPIPYQIKKQFTTNAIFVKSCIEREEYGFVAPNVEKRRTFLRQGVLFVVQTLSEGIMNVIARTGIFVNLVMTKAATNI